MSTEGRPGLASCARMIPNKVVHTPSNRLPGMVTGPETPPTGMVETNRGVYIAEDHTVENMNKYLWRGKYYHLDKVDMSLDMFDRLDRAYFQIMEKAEVEKIDPAKEQEIMAIAQEATQG